MSLYLLVLSFFILLVTISSFEEIKTKAVMASLNSTFTSVRPPRTDPTIFTSRAGSILAGPQFMIDLDNLFSTALGVTKVEIVQPGRVMRVTMATESLFLPNETGVRESQFPLIDRIITALNGRPRGTHFDMEFVLGSPFSAGRTLPTGQTLPMARSGAFARELMSRGVPPDAISIGLRPGDPAELVMWFYVRAEDEEKILYERFASEPNN